MNLLYLILIVTLLAPLTISGAVPAAVNEPATKPQPTGIEGVSKGATNLQRTRNEVASNRNANEGRLRTMGDDE